MTASQVRPDVTVWFSRGKRSRGSLSLSLPPSTPSSHHRPPYMGRGRRCPGWSSLSRSHHSWSGCCQRGDGLPHMEKGVALFCRPLFSHTVIGVINWTAVPLQYPPPGSLTHTVKIQRPVLIWWVALTEGWLSLKNRQKPGNVGFCHRRTHTKQVAAAWV